MENENSAKTKKEEVMKKIMLFCFFAFVVISAICMTYVMSQNAGENIGGAAGLNNVTVEGVIVDSVINELPSIEVLVKEDVMTINFVDNCVVTDTKGQKRDMDYLTTGQTVKVTYFNDGTLDLASQVSVIKEAAVK
ncbi:MAG: hypothetical protein JW938_04240 [Candidatus Omnitrophica bacterium]|nr:hypothetical protein [Candidatus Omnitrophota bacterium]